MKKRIFFAITTMLFGVNCAMQAQYNEDDEIIITDSEGKQEEIDLPESMGVELDSLLNLYYSKTYLQPDEDCNYQNVNPTYDKQVYIDRLKRLPNVMEMPYNDIVQKFIDRYTNRLRHSVSYMLGAANFYVPIFEEALETYGLPLELKYLPVIESALNPKATSRVGAAGLWQFMVATGKQYGLEVNSLIDERRDPIKSSYAAARYLKDLYKIFGDWNLVIAAYNCGPQGINKAIHRAKGLTDYWDIYPYLPRETRGYVPAFIAANYIMTYYCDHNICPMVAELPVKTDTVMLDRDVHFEQIAKVLNVSVEEIQQLNPQYRRNIINGSSKPSSLRLPAMKINQFIDKQDSIYSCTVDNFQNKRTEVDVTEPTAQMSSGKRTSSHNTKYGRKGRRRNSRSRSKSVTIRQGDTLSDIARRNGTTVAKLKRLNKISGSSIRAGKKLKVK